MTLDDKDRRWTLIIEMLYGIATGNFALRMERSEHDDTLESVAVLLNMIAEEFQGALFYSLFINQRFSYDFLVHNTFVLDEHHRIINVSSAIPLQLGIAESRLLRMAFPELLDTESQKEWNRIFPEAMPLNAIETFNVMRFRTAEGLFVSTLTTITKLAGLSQIFISFITVFDQSLYPQFHTARKATPIGSTKRGIVILQQLYDYIFNHLETPLPSVKQLARMLGTNENKLRALFRDEFGTSIYQFYNNARLEKAHVMIAQTGLPLHSIAALFGYEYYGNFSNSFKKRFGYAPSSVKRWQV